MDRSTATAMIEQLCRDLPREGTPAADDFDYGWFRDRVFTIAEHCRPIDAMYVWQYAIWHPDRAGLLPEGAAPHHEV